MKKEKTLIIFITLILVLLTGVSIIFILVPKQQNRVFAVWWWDNRLDDSYFDFAYNNNVNEIYYYSSSLNEKTNEFIAKANSKSIKVYWLIGECEWIENYEQLENKIKQFLEYQNNYENKFVGLHLDIEPHQFDDFENRKLELLTKFVELVMYIRNQFSQIWIEYDIPVWMHDEVFIKNIKKPVYEFIIDNCDRVTLMSYRDSYNEIFKCAEDEIKYAASVNKQINLGVETQKLEDNYITFFEEGKNFMYQELDRLKQITNYNFGIAIHHIKSWYELKD